jgi:hypothetical protein
MVTIVERRLGRGRRRKLETRAMTSAQGKRVRASRVEARSDSFADDLLTSFSRSVERARRENRTLFGQSDLTDGDGE